MRVEFTLSGEQLVADAFLAVSLLGFCVQAWAARRIYKSRAHGGVWRTSLCRVGCAVVYIVVGVNAIWGQWATLQVSLTAFILTQATWQANAWLDVRDGRRAHPEPWPLWTAPQHRLKDRTPA